MAGRTPCPPRKTVQTTLAFRSSLALNAGSPGTPVLTTPPATRLVPPSATILEGSASPDSERSGTRTGSAAGWSTQTGSSILSSAEAYERSKGEQNISGPYTVQVRLMLRVLTGGLAVATALGLKRVALTVPNLKAKRQKYETSRQR